MNTAERIIRICDERVEELRNIAQEAADNFWTMRMAGNKEVKIIRKSNLGCRVVSQGSQFRITWFYNTYQNNPDGSGLKKTFSNHITKKRDAARYSDSVLRKHATKWEWDYVVEAESIFELVRKELQALARIRRALITQKKVSAELQKLHQTTEDEDIF